MGFCVSIAPSTSHVVSACGCAFCAFIRFVIRNRTKAAHVFESAVKSKREQNHMQHSRQLTARTLPRWRMIAPLQRSYATSRANRWQLSWVNERRTYAKASNVINNLTHILCGWTWTTLVSFGWAAQISLLESANGICCTYSCFVLCNASTHRRIHMDALHT